MSDEQRDKIEYEFEDLRRNSDPIPGSVLEQLGLDEEDLEESERHEGDDKDSKKEVDGDEKLELDDGDGDQDDPDDDGYDTEEMSRSMRKSIMRVKREAQQRIDKAEAEAGETISKLEKRVDELERAGKTDKIDNEYTGKIEALEAKIETAMEKGDSKEVTRLTRELSELTVEKRFAERDLAAEDDDSGDGDSQEEVRLLPRVQQWIDEQDWWDDPEHGHVRAYVRKVDIALQRKGYRPSDDDYYEQLEAKVDEKFPNVIELTMSDDFKDEDEEDEDDEFSDIPPKGRAAKKTAGKKRTRRGRSPVSDGGDGSDAGGGSRKKTSKKRGKTLSKARIANMVFFGMDPENPAHVEAYMESIED